MKNVCYIFFPQHRLARKSPSPTNPPLFDPDFANVNIKLQTQTLF